MPTPILKINIDDEAFKRYMSAFAKYQEQLKAQPEMWQGINDGMGAMALAGAAIAAEIAHQGEETRKLAAEEAKREEAEKKAAKDKKDRDNEEAGREKEAAARRRHAIDQVKEYSRSVADAAMNLGKWALIGEGASLAAGALSFWGLDRLVSGVGEERRLSQGLGVSMGQRQGMGLNMQRYFDVNSVLESVANAQATPASWGLFRMMGVDPTGDPAQVAGNMAIAARRMFINDRGNLGLAGAQGLTQIFSPDDLRRLAATKEGDLRQSIADSSKFQGLSDETGRKWQSFMVRLDTAGLKLQNALIDKLSILEPDLEKVIGKFTELAVTVLDRIDFKKLGDGLDAFTKYIGSTQFQNDFKTFVDDVGLVAKKIADALVFLGVIPSAAGGPQSPGGGAVAIGGAAAIGAGLGSPFGLSGMAVGGALGAGVGFMYNGAQHSRLVQLEHDYGLPKGSLAAIYGMESGYGKHSGMSSAGALGPFQLMAGTAAQYGVTDRSSFQQESTAAAKIMRDELKKYHGDLSLALAAYNWGGGNVDRDLKRHGAGWLGFAPKETQKYVRQGLQLTLKNQTGASVATTVNSAAGG